MASMLVDGSVVEVTAEAEAAFRAMQAEARAQSVASMVVPSGAAQIAIHRWGKDNGRPTLLAEIEAVIASLEAAGDPEPGIWWRKASHFERSSPQVNSIGEAVGLSAAQIDEIVALATTIS